LLLAGTLRLGALLNPEMQSLPAMPAEVLIATLMRPEGESGLQTHFQQFGRYLNDHDVSFALVTPFDAPKPIVYPTFAVRKILGPLSGSLSVWWYLRWHTTCLQHALWKRLSDGKPRIVYAQNPPSAGAALRVRANSSQRVVMAAHFNTSEAIEWADKGLISRQGQLYRSIQVREFETLRGIDGIVYFSDYTRHALQKKIFGVDAIPYRLIPNFIADSNIGKPVTEQALTDLVNVGTFEPRKNQSFILDILAAARDHGYSLTATFIGDGPTRAEIEWKARHLGLTDRVRFLGYIPNAAEKMEGHRAYIHAARMENFPFALVEAMARGLPIFAAPVGGVPEVFQDGVEGQYLSLHNAQENAERILKILVNPSLLATMGSASRARFLQCYETKVVAPKLLNFLRGIGETGDETQAA
jgi:glycosyltransferase involved in cell wall biosynthesis